MKIQKYKYWKIVKFKKKSIYFIKIAILFFCNPLKYIKTIKISKYYIKNSKNENFSHKIKMIEIEILNFFITKLKKIIFQKKYKF